MEAVTRTPEREAFYKKIDGENLSALWNVLGDLITPEPKSACQPHLWKFDAIRDYMNEAGKLIKPDVKTGDRVLFGKWSGTEVKLDGEELLIMKESDIMGVIG